MRTRGQPVLRTEIPPWNGSIAVLRFASAAQLGGTLAAVLLQHVLDCIIKSLSLTALELTVEFWTAV